MLAWHFVRVMLHLWAGLLICAVIFPISKVATHERLIRWWSKKMLLICGVELTISDQRHGATEEQVLIVSNHVSWLDIFVLNSLQPCYFVAKSDIRSWPMIGWLSEKAGTIFLARGKQREVRRIYEGLVHQIQAGKRIAFFPEGTTAAQGTILPFHANLFEAAIEAKVPVQPFSIRYLDSQGALNPAADFIGDMTFVESISVILKSGKIIAELSQLPTISTDGAHRRETAQAARLAVAQSLGIQTEL
ncbi:lysophospholipid acyltransferase family protein [soil metagenome]